MMLDDKDKIDNLKKKIDQLKNNKDNENKNRKMSGASFGFKISTEIVAALIVGVGIGIIVDNFFDTSPFGLIIFFIIGAFAGFLNVYRVMRHIEKK
tara:strand:- start:1340 stop:1627 length:288 start_codon:yes stop_codon:yes gene_type:complete